MYFNRSNYPELENVKIAQNSKILKLHNKCDLSKASKKTCGQFGSNLHHIFKNGDVFFVTKDSFDLLLEGSSPDDSNSFYDYFGPSVYNLDIDECYIFLIKDRLNGSPATFLVDVKTIGDKTISIVAYAITKSIIAGFVHFSITHTDKDWSEIDVHDVAHTEGLNSFPKELVENQTIAYVNYAFRMFLFKKFIHIDKAIVNKSTGKVRIANDKYKSDYDVDVNIMDSLWFTEILRTEGFGVRGHFRLQPYGPKRKKVKLKYIKPFRKNGYHRKSTKQLYEEK